MDRILQMMPEIEHEEYQYLLSLTKDFDDAMMQEFVLTYRSKRKAKDTILIGALIGLLGIGGIHRFMLDQIFMGILYLLTAGLCYIGTIIDLINYKKLTLRYNKDAAFESAMLIKQSNFRFK